MEKKVVDVEQLIKVKDALARLVENPELFKKAAEAFEREDTETFRGVLREIGILRFCWLICRWFCIKRRGFVCVTLCPRKRAREPEPTFEEMLEFGQAAVRLMEREEDFKALFDAYSRRDVERFQSILEEYEMMRFCVQICRWFSHYYCRVKCVLFCPPSAKIISPSALACVQPKPIKVNDDTIMGVEIKGIASGGAPFLYYRLDYSSDGGTTWRQDAPGSGDIVIIYPDGHRGGVSTQPVGPPPDILGYLETTNLLGQTYSLKLTVTGGSAVVTDISQFQLHQKAVIIDEVGKIPVTVVEPAPPPPEPPRKLVLADLERAVGGYVTIGGSAYVEGCGQRYEKYKLMWAEGWINQPTPGTNYDDIGAPSTPWWQLIREVDYTGMPIFICFHNNSPVGDLTRRWVRRKCLLLFDYDRLEWSPWYSTKSGKVTLLLVVKDDATPPNTYFNSLQIWVDNITIEAILDSIGIPGKAVNKCEPLSISDILKSGGILEIKGTAWDDEIESGNLNPPSLNFDRFNVLWKKDCDPSYHSEGIELMPKPGTPPPPPPPEPGKERIKNDILATWDIRDPSDPTKARPEIEPCAYIIQLNVWDNSRINDDGSHYVHKELAFTLEA